MLQSDTFLLCSPPPVPSHPLSSSCFLHFVAVFIPLELVFFFFVIFYFDFLCCPSSPLLKFPFPHSIFSALLLLHLLSPSLLSSSIFFICLLFHLLSHPILLFNISSSLLPSSLALLFCLFPLLPSVVSCFSPIVVSDLFFCPRLLSFPLTSYSSSCPFLWCPLLIPPPLLFLLLLVSSPLH